MGHTFRPLLLATVLIACAPLTQAATTLVYCSEASPAGFDPSQYTSGTEFDASAETVFNRLTQFERGSTNVEPGLATRWEVSADGLRYTFHLRPNVKFHTTDYFTPTRDFNADDVLFTFNRLLDPNYPFRKAYPSESPYFNDMGLNTTIKSVDKIDDLTVRFSLNNVDAAFIQNLAMSFASVQSAEYAAQLLKEGKAADINQKPIGTGPFVFKRYQKDSQIRYSANTAYWKPEDVKIDNLIFSINTDAAVRVQKLKTNECQVSGYPRPQDIELLEKDPNITVLSQPGFNLGFLAYNVTHKPLDQLKVRQALDMAIDKPAIIKAVYQSAGQLAQNALPPNQWSYDPTIKDAPYDPTKAKQLLKEAGIAPGTEISLWAMTVQRASNPNARMSAQMIQADWAKIGIKATIVSYEWGEYIKRAKNGEHDVMTYGWTGDNGDPDNWLGVLYSCAAVTGSNFAKWCDPAYDALVKKAKVTSDRAERIKLYQQAQHILKEQVPITPIANSKVFQPMRKEVQNFKLSPFGLTPFYGVSLSQ
ncbi:MULTISPECIES: ABC transporter substrate-binding protein [unclassified Pseudomonas]|uniref:ABC transporter substrate-binding protein n=1 Tax=unclassified Pseudomonas TaxID=196821 RepID=UPI002AC8EB96|nr:MULTISPECIES: ABC transporter substrate-binding protein [unclassified Pseudomonas]MEB0040393.1 ABC transporter substrate-binding protein [Pseudomonas sp. MH10]MEB0078223.1 ABC transporter substrate-binding protein [Pseudomonas sp. MH10out]MEB0093108.1 ABC transporter substrate-binding protein [Pseudomonas sp. CCI4.2]MEB0100015.1 ABC transporter substrate-binding protein [Pseudomonas sp. CCI3.2]MEB0120894.1 ABC transporter substrate-binding protein [Pseudomonas sp. CCI1.2]